jgi:O-antigen ligase/polysaccharide polymerase Wzy-like membrane protein
MSSSRSRAAPLLAALLFLAALGLAGVVGLAYVRSPALGAVLALALGVSGLALRYPDVATYAVLFLLYSNLPGVGVAFHGVPKPVAAAFPLLLAVPLVRDLLVRRQSFVLTPALFMLVLLLVVQALGAAFSIDPAKSFGAVTTFAVEGLALYLLMINVLRSKEVLRGASWALVAAGILMSVVPLFQQFTGTFQNNYGGLAQVDGLGFTTTEGGEEGAPSERQARLAGPVGEKNRYAQVMLVLVPIGLSCAFRARGLLKLFALGATFCISLGFVLAFSRGGAIGMLCMLAVAVGLRLIDMRKAMFAAGGMALLLMAMPQYWKRLETIATSVQVLDDDSGAAAADGATRRRITEMMAAVRVFIDHPVIGVGPGLFKEYSQEYGNQDALRRIESGRRAHSLYLELAAETGGIGLALFLAALLVTFVGLAGARRLSLHADPELADLATTYLLALVCYCSTGVFLHLAYMRYFYVVLALGGAVAHVGYEAHRARQPRPEVRLAGSPAVAGGGA